MSRRILVALAGLLSCVTPAFAQDRFWFFSGGWANAVVTQIDVTDAGRTWTTTGKWTIAAGYPLSPNVPVLGGRYLVWLAPATPESHERGVLAYLDTRTGQNGAIAGVSFSSYELSIAADRQSGRLFVLEDNGLWVLNPRAGTVKLISMPRSVGELRMVQAAGGRVFIRRSIHIFAAPDVLVIDPDTGTQLAEFPISWRVEFTRDEKFFFLISSGWVYRHVTATLARVSEVPYQNPDTTTLLDPVRLSRRADGWFVYDADGRSLIGTALAGMYTGRRVRFWRPGARSPVYVESYKTGIYESEFDNRIDVIDPSLATTVQTVPDVRFPRAMMAVPEPPALLANVLHQTVTIMWDSVEHAGEYQLEAGFRPSGREIGTFNLGPTRSVTIPNVPRGIYFVRVRARNELGASKPSADVRIDVP